MVRVTFIFALLGLACTSAAVAQLVPDPARVNYAGVSGARLIDAGVMVVTGGGPAFDRTEAFEYLSTSAGGVVLLNTITMTDGRYRVQARFDLDADWNARSADGLGLYEGVPVVAVMRRDGREVRIAVRSLGDGGAKVSLDPTAACDPDCFINMSPSALAMFVMTRHYDLARGGPQTFRWTGQDLDRVRTLSGGTATLSFAGERVVPRATGETALRHFTFVESLPLPDGGRFTLNFDLWTDREHRPMGFRVRTPGAAGGTFGFRQGFEDVRAALQAD
ncbi:MAG: hypothetical protein SFV21_03735 [Rhodospirillaceae bacterium]|nr:hypothetical protein [Rhodospirillaceae bacterium]